MSIRIVEGGGAMGAAIRAIDWASSPLGPLDAWPSELRTTLSLILASKFPMCIVWGADRVTLHNDAFTPILGNKAPALGRSFRELWSEVWEEIEPIVDKAFAGEATYIEDLPLIVDRRGYVEQAYFTFCYSPIRNEGGDVVGMLDTVVETTDKVLAEKHTQALNQELAHRLQNTLTTVCAITRQTFRQNASPDEMLGALIDRFSALGRVHAILMLANWSAARIRDIVESAMAPHVTASQRISIEGPQVVLSAKQAVALALAIHELCTNALKYGSLSVDTGRVTIQWEAGAAASDPFTLTWSEYDGPAVPLPTRRGFGTRLLEEVLAREFRGAVRLTFDTGGVRCTLTTQMRRLYDERPLHA